MRTAHPPDCKLRPGFPLIPPSIPLLQLRAEGVIYALWAERKRREGNWEGLAACEAKEGEKDDERAKQSQQLLWLFQRLICVTTPQIQLIPIWLYYLHSSSVRPSFGLLPN